MLQPMHLQYKHFKFHENISFSARLRTLKASDYWQALYLQRLHGSGVCSTWQVVWKGRCLQFRSFCHWSYHRKKEWSLLSRFNLHLTKGKPFLHYIKVFFSNLQLNRHWSSLLLKVWNFYGEGRLYAAVDPILGGDYPRDQASWLLQIGLVCVQAFADLRPSMSMVVKMLNGNYEIPQPKQPPYLHPSSGDIKKHNSSDSSNPNLYSNSKNSQTSMTQSINDPRWVLFLWNDARPCI